MPILKRRPSGSKTEALTIRIDSAIYNELIEYAYSQRESMSLVLDRVISKGIEGLRKTQ